MVAIGRLFWLAAAFAASYAKSSSGNSVLVIVEPKKQADYTIFLDGLRGKGYELTFRAPRADAPLLMQDGVPNFAHVIFFAPETKSFAQDITPQSLVSLLGSKTNLLIALSTKQTPLTSLAAEFSLAPAPPGTPLISYLPERSEPPNVIPILPPSDSQILSSTSAPVWFSGTPMALGNNPMIVPILNAPPYAFASEVDGGSPDALVDASEKGGEGLWAGSRMGVVTGFQATTGARVVWAGGAELFSDEYAKKPISKGVESGNKQFAQDVASWAFQESLVLRIDSTEHHKFNASQPSEQYTVNDQLVYTAHISRFDPEQGVWKPYSGLKDLQLEFTMLDPHIRIALPPVEGLPGTYSVQFRAPDRHGVFKFVINYKRKGFTHMLSSSTVSLVPPRHDQYPRFISAAWPYYIGAMSTSVGFLLFSTIWLAGEIKVNKKGKARKTE